MEQLALPELPDVEEPRAAVWLAPSRAEQFDTAAERFVVEHPDAWRLFVRFTFERIRVGAVHGGAKAVWERIRWERDTTAHHAGREWCLNNNLVASLARAFERTYPEHAGFFRKRSRAGDEAPVEGEAAA